MWSTKVRTQLWRAKGRNISSTATVCANHYDVLGISPKATQAEVKAAYYKKSKLHHPDTTAHSGEGTDQFRLVTEAYEVLGNYKSRQMYDRGLYGHRQQDLRKAKTSEDPKASFYKSRLNKEKVPTMGGESIYNFDEWTQQHYSNAFQMSRILKDPRYRNTDFNHHHKQESMDNKYIIASTRFLLTVTLLLMFFSYASSNDVVQSEKLSNRYFPINQTLFKTDDKKVEPGTIAEK